MRNGANGQEVDMVPHGALKLGRILNRHDAVLWSDLCHDVENGGLGRDEDEVGELCSLECYVLGDRWSVD